MATIAASLLAPGVLRAQRVAMSVDCKAERLDGGQRATCASPRLMQLSARIDSATAGLEARLTGEDEQILFDTELPARTQRNDCQNHAPRVPQCVDSVLSARLRALVTTSASPDSIRAELARYDFISVPYLLQWGEALTGRRLHVWGCLVLEPGADFATRLHGFVSTDCYRADAPSAAVVFTRMFPGRAALIDSAHPAAHWLGTVKRVSNQPVFEIDPGI